MLPPLGFYWRFYHSYTKTYKATQFAFRFGMINFDLLLTLVCLIQPLLIGILIVLGIKGQKNFSYFKLYSAIRESSQPSRLYECSTYSRLSSKFTYQVWTLSLMMAFLIYDIEVLFLTSLIGILFIGSLLDWAIILLLVIGLAFAVIYDYSTEGILWKS